MRTIHGSLLPIHTTVLRAVCGDISGADLVADLDRATEGTMLLPGFGTGDAQNPSPYSPWDCEAVVAWWTAARLASEAMAHALLEEDAPPKMEPKKKKKTKTAKKKKKPRAWSAMYTFDPVPPGEFDPTAAMLFLERRVTEVLSRVGPAA